MNDDEIINLFLKRDENGIIELSTKYHPYCYKIAWNLLANREDAEECLNDTWFSVWSQIPPTQPPVLVLAPFFDTFRFSFNMYSPSDCKEKSRVSPAFSYVHHEAKKKFPDT